MLTPGRIVAPAPIHTFSATSIGPRTALLALDDSVASGDGQSFAALSCLDAGEALPSAPPAGTNFTGTVVLETAAESGWVTLTPIGTGWELLDDVS